MVGLLTLAGYVLPTLAAMGTTASLVNINVGAGFIGLVFALLLLITTRVGQGASLMVTDGRVCAGAHGAESRKVLSSLHGNNPHVHLNPQSRYDVQHRIF